MRQILAEVVSVADVVHDLLAKVGFLDGFLCISWHGLRASRLCLLGGDTALLTVDLVFAGGEGAIEAFLILTGKHLEELIVMHTNGQLFHQAFVLSALDVVTNHGGAGVI